MCALLDLGYVRSLGQPDAQPALAPFRLVVLGQLQPKLARRAADDGIDFRVKRRAAIENIKADRVLFERLAVAGSRFFDDIPQQPGQPRTAREYRRSEDRSQFLACPLACRINLSIITPTHPLQTGGAHPNFTLTYFYSRRGNRIMDKFAAGIGADISRSEGGYS